MFFALLICNLLVLIYIALKTASSAKWQVALGEYLQTELKQIRNAQTVPLKPLSRTGGSTMGFPLSRHAKRRGRHWKIPHGTKALTNT